MNALRTEHPDTGVIRWTFASTQDRDAFLTEAFPSRKASDAPGCYELPGRDTLGVLLNEVFFGAACVCSYAASGSHTLACLTYANRRVDAVMERVK